MAVIRTGYNSLGTPCSFLLFSLAISEEERAGGGRRGDRGCTFHRSNGGTTSTHTAKLPGTPKLSLLPPRRLNLKTKIGDPFGNLSVG